MLGYIHVCRGSSVFSSLFFGDRYACPDLVAGETIAFASGCLLARDLDTIVTVIWETKGAAWHMIVSDGV